jgi:AraC-like DNA-binding protein
MQSPRRRRFTVPAEAFDRWALRLIGGNDAGTLSCGFLSKRPGWDSRASRRPSTSLVLCLAGDARYDDRWPIEPGDVFIRFAGVAHDLEILSGPWHECWLSFGAGIEPLLGLDRAVPVRRTSVTDAWVRTLGKAIEPLHRAGEQELPHQMAYLLSLAADLLRQPAGPDLDLPRACHLLADPAVPLTEVAESCGLTYDRFRRDFQRQMAISPGAYRTRRLMERARFQLMNSRQPIHGIAEALGYANPFAFTNAFRRAVGTSPSAWRRGVMSADQV